MRNKYIFITLLKALSTKVRFLISASLAIGGIFLPLVVFAQSSGVYALVGLPANDNGLLIMRIFQLIWIVVGLLSLILLIVGFLRVRNAGDNLSDGATGKRFILIGGVGLGLSLLLTVILFFIYGSLERKFVLGGNETKKPSQEDSAQPSFGRYLNQYLKITDHFPARDDKNIPRNVKILITFAEPLSQASIMDSSNALKKEAIRIMPKGAAFSASLSAHAEVSADHKILSLTPDKLLGELNAKTLYSITVTDRVLKETGESFLGVGQSYSWQFEVSGVVDNTPAQVESLVPFATTDVQKNSWPMNTLVQVTFTKPVDPSALSGKKLFVMNETAKKPVEGTWTLGNSYRTLSFSSQEPCGKNACQETLFCLPKDSILRVTVLAATLSQPKKAENPNRSKLPLDGVADLSGNSLDGGGEAGVQKNGKSDGPSQDNLTWSFKTSGDKETSTPVLEFMQPGRDATGVDLNAPIELLFSKLLDLTSIHNGTVVLSNEVSTWMTAKNYDQVKKTSVKVNHDPFKKDTLYTPTVKAELHDVFQQCFYPCNGPPK